MLPEDLALLCSRHRRRLFHWVHEGESWEGLAGRAHLAPLVHWRGDRLTCELSVDVADVRGTRLERREEWTRSHRLTVRLEDKSCSPLISESPLPLLGWTGVWPSWPGGRTSWRMQRRDVPAAPPGYTPWKLDPLCLSVFRCIIACLFCFFLSPLTKSRLPPNRFEMSLSSSPSNSEQAAGDAPLRSSRGAWIMFSNIFALIWL